MKQIIKAFKYLFPGVLLLSSVQVNAAPDGEKLYRLYCEACHQTTGEGGIGLPLSSQKLLHVSDSYLEKTIRLGRPGRIMPAYDSLSDAQVRALIGFMRGWSGQPEMTFSDTKITGNADNGKLLYKKKCAKCHADDGSGEGKGTGVTKSRERLFMIMPAAIDNSGYHASVTDEGIREIIVADREDSKMPSMQGKLSAAEIDDVVAYVRSLRKPPQAVTEDEDDELSLVMESDKDFESSIESVRAALTGSNFRIFPERLLEEGLTDEFSHNKRQVRVRFCNFSTLYDMLRIEPRLGVVLPCSITVVERSDGSVLLIAPNIKKIAAWFNNDELGMMSEQMHESIISVLEEATL